MMYVVGFGGWTGYMQRENLVCSVSCLSRRANERTSERGGWSLMQLRSRERPSDIMKRKGGGLYCVR